MMNEFSALVVLAAATIAAFVDITLDGVIGSDAYSNSESVGWFNGHKAAESIYGDFDGQLGSTTLSYGESDGCFIVHVKSPLYAKNMIWEDIDWHSPILNTNPSLGLTEDDADPYRTHHETHHRVGTMNLDFNGATGNKKIIFLDANATRLSRLTLLVMPTTRSGLLGTRIPRITFLTMALAPRH